jgi:hypothetical protein
MNPKAPVSLAVAVTALCACAHPTPVDLASWTTRAIYDADAAAARRHFARDVVATMSDASVADVSAIMHRFGAYRAVTAVSSGPQPLRYDFEAFFENGSMLLQLKLDSDGRIIGYRLIPNQIVER